MRLLVVEDEPDLRRGLVQALREDGYAVDAAADGQSGLEKALAWPYDAIVLDLMLPLLSGLELLASLRSSHNTPVLILTARDAVQDRVFGLDQGADDYLIKPYDLDELKARLRSLIRRTSGSTTSLIRIGEVEIDMGGKVVTRAGKPTELTAREYSIVELLALHRGKLVSRTMIYDHVFDESHDSLSNLVDVYISRIRSQLGRELIKTRRGQGYIIDD